MTNRRDFLKLATAAVAAGAAPLAASEGIAAPLAAVAAETPPAPAPALPWKWWYSRDQEHYQGPFETREAAIEQGAEDARDSCWPREEGVATIDVCEAHQHVPDTHFRIFYGDEIAELITDHVVRRLDEDDEGELNPEEPPFQNVTREDWKLLTNRLNAAIVAWVNEDGIREKLLVWCFQGQRNSEEVLVSLEPEAGA